MTIQKQKEMVLQNDIETKIVCNYSKVVLFFI